MAAEAAEAELCQCLTLMIHRAGVLQDSQMLTVLDSGW